jgi:hypothetical protein
MANQAKVSMMLCWGLERDEQEKLDRLDGPISARFIHAGLVARICQGSGRGDQRIPHFCGPNGIVGSIRASAFLAASDQNAVAMIAFANS